MRSIDLLAACLQVLSRAERVREVVERVYDWETARRSISGIMYWW